MFLLNEIFLGIRTKYYNFCNGPNHTSAICTTYLFGVALPALMSIKSTFGITENALNSTTSRTQDVILHIKKKWAHPSPQCANLLLLLVTGKITWPAKKFKINFSDLLSVNCWFVYDLAPEPNKNFSGIEILRNFNQEHK